MGNVITTVQLPNGEPNRGSIAAASQERELLCGFRDIDLRELQGEMDEAEDDIEALILPSELERKRRLLFTSPDSRRRE